MNNRPDLRKDVLETRSRREEHVEAAKKPDHLSKLLAGLAEARAKAKEKGQDPNVSSQTLEKMFGEEKARRMRREAELRSRNLPPDA